MSHPLISVITPCYNHGQFLDENVKSVIALSDKVPLEHIIVNDGSTDVKTIEKLTQLKSKGVIVMHQENGGPANARNTAIRASSAEYILPLDADNTLIAEVFEKAFFVMDEDPTIAVVYTDANCFGDMEYAWKPGDIDPYKFLAANYLDTCSLIRKQALIEVDMYDDQIPVHGNEDWDLWLKLIFAKKQFRYLQEIGFKYRVLNDSLSRRESTPKQEKINQYIAKKYAIEYARHYAGLWNEKKKLDNLKSFLRQEKLKSIIKVLFNKPVIKY